MSGFCQRRIHKIAGNPLKLLVSIFGGFYMVVSANPTSRVGEGDFRRANLVVRELVCCHVLRQLYEVRANPDLEDPPWGQCLER